MPCVARRDRTGAYTCNRCGYTWDMDDDAPDCKTWQQIKKEKQDRKHKEREASKAVGRLTLQLIVKNIKDEKPKNKQYVLIHLLKNNWGDIDDPNGNRYWTVAKYVEGLTEEDRKKLNINDPRKNRYQTGDVFGNNTVPYEFTEFGPSNYFGQEVDFWCELPCITKPTEA